jgi:predicted enzyme related to lactoylglutathione lyase
MINAMHVLIYSANPAADRAFLRDVLGWPYVEDAGPEPGWLIFRTPPAELGVHPTDAAPAGPIPSEIFLMCDDIEATAASLTGQGVATTPIEDRRYGRAVSATLPSGGTIGLYEPRHATAYNLPS